MEKGSASVFRDLLFKVRGHNAADEVTYLFDLFVGILLRRVKRNLINPGQLLFKDVVLRVKHLEDSYFYVPAGTDALLQVLPYYEIRTMQFVRSILEHGDVFVDVGAHIGTYAIPMAKRVGPTGLVVAVEPSPIYRVLERNMRLNGLTNILIANKAAYSERGLIDFYYNPKHSGISSFFKKGSEGIGIRVRAEPLDDILAEAGLLSHKIRLIKIDVEGAELDVLLGSKLALTRTEYLVFEARGKTIEGCSEELSKYGFEVRLLEVVNACDDNTSNYVAVKRGAK